VNFDWELNTEDEFLENGNNKTKSLGPRERNEITASLIQKQIGDIEQVRATIGLNKKRMCELLLIDPSTWTRWTTGKTTPPPWVYRTLQWGLAVMDKHPEFHPLLINQTAALAPSNTNSLDSSEIRALSNEISEVKKDLKKWILIANASILISALLLITVLIY